MSTLGDFFILFSLFGESVGVSCVLAMSSERSKAGSLSLRSPEHLGSWIGERQDRKRLI